MNPTTLTIIGIWLVIDGVLSLIQTKKEFESYPKIAISMFAGRILRIAIGIILIPEAWIT